MLKIGNSFRKEEYLQRKDYIKDSSILKNLLIPCKLYTIFAMAMAAMEETSGNWELPRLTEKFVTLSSLCILMNTVFFF